jgi:hypothetical protein
MHLPGAEVLRHAQHVADQVLELQPALVVVGLAEAARVPRGDLEAVREALQLRRPVAAVAADAVQQQDQAAGARDRYGEARRGPDEDGLGGGFQGLSRETRGRLHDLRMISYGAWRR